ncbi:hypothetical protein [Flavobacterium aquicola]|uniref:Carboxypeptidase-like protein n=1 Tax=Flavobacterium aquicola TaxID=1682742 RepID=A0A3E0EFZ4_9FLAO|nr:hypothetical protein [Flavobacterium aquicola]REG96199.1 hypothetical protein C8P67_11018 [Flavobacterium aquicola]
MKVKLLVTLSLLASQFSFSQNVELLHGKVLNQDLRIKNVDVINFNSKEQTKTDQFGVFFIVAKTNDILVFVSKSYELKRLLVNQKLFEEKALCVFMDLKPEELEDVVITKMPSIKLSGDKKYEQSKLDDYALEKTPLKIPHVNDGTIQYGMDFMRIGGMLFGLFAKEKEPKKEAPPKIEFATLAKNTCEQNFFTENLKLKEEEIELFLQFCDADPNSKRLKENTNKLSMMDFLIIKKSEFQNLKKL